jgi:hypothetical protein
MSVSYFVRYQGRAADETAFIDYYVTQHAAVLVRFPGIRSLTLHRPVENAALASEARSQARDDFANFPRFDGTVTHQAMSSRIIF